MRINANGRSQRASMRRTRSVVLALLLAAVAGCSGSGGGGTEPLAPPPAAGSGGTLKVTVSDVYGVPVSGAQVSVSAHVGPPPSPPASVTDELGKAIRVSAYVEKPFRLADLVMRIRTLVKE